MPAWFQRLFGPGPASRRELVELRGSVEALDARCEWLWQELKKLRGRVYAAEKFDRSPEDAPGPPNGGDEAPGGPPQQLRPMRALRRW